LLELDLLVENYPFSNRRLNSSLSLAAHTTILSNPSIMGGLCFLVLRAASSLDAFSSYPREA